eukprot:9178597-Pyramimonas_sp.AAC.1
MEVWYTELHEEKEQMEATPLDDLDTVPTHMITDSSVLVTVAEEQRGHLPKRVHPRDSDTGGASSPTVLCGRRPQLWIGLGRESPLCRTLLRCRNVTGGPIRTTAYNIIC